MSDIQSRESLADDAITQAQFWSTVAQRYDEVVDLQIGPQTRSMVRQRLGEEGRLGRVAEFGCGTGFYTQVLADMADAVVATDISPGMLEIARHRVAAPNVTFQVENCQATSLPGDCFDTAFISLVLHFTEPQRTLAEMHRILRSGGALIVANLDPGALNRLDRLRSLVRIVYHGVTGYRVKPPKGFGQRVLTEPELCALLARSGFRIASSETITDPSRSSNIPIDYVCAVRE